VWLRSLGGSLRHSAISRFTHFLKRSRVLCDTQRQPRTRRSERRDIEIAQSIGIGKKGEKNGSKQSESEIRNRRRENIKKLLAYR
jgi:hypothetical protein